MVHNLPARFGETRIKPINISTAKYTNTQAKLAEWSRIHLPSRRHGFDPWVRRIPQRRKWQPSPVFLPGKIHRQRSLSGYSPWGCLWDSIFIKNCSKQNSAFNFTLSSGLIIYLHYAQFCSRRITISCKKNNKLSERNLLRVPVLYSQVNFYCPLSFISNMNHSALLASNPHAC